MSPILTIARATVREASRRRLLWLALVAGGLLLGVFAVALRLQVLQFQGRAMSPFLRYQVESGMLMIGLYTCDLAAIVLTILASIDSVAGEIGSGTIHAIATKPIARWQILAGKFLGFAGMIAVYVAASFAATLWVAHAVTGVLPSHPLRGASLMFFECMIALALSFLFGTRLSTLTNGVVVLGLTGLGLMGGWLEQVSGFSQSAAVVKLAVITSLIMPAESVWRRAAYEMQTPLAGSLSFSPFANVSIPSWTAIGYAGLYFVVVLALAVRRFEARDL